MLVLLPAAELQQMLDEVRAVAFDVGFDALCCPASCRAVEIAVSSSAPELQQVVHEVLAVVA